MITPKDPILNSAVVAGVGDPGHETGDVEEYNGRTVQPIDDGWLSKGHATAAAQGPTSKAFGRMASNGGGASSIGEVNARRGDFTISRGTPNAEENGTPAPTAPFT